MKPKRRPLGRIGRTVPRWWVKPTPPGRAQACYRTKAGALKVFEEHNAHVIQPAGGLHAKDSLGVGFEALNHKYGLKGKKRVFSLAEAIWLAMPEGGPFCLDRLDIKTLNETDAAREHGGFRLPDEVQEESVEDEQEAYYRSSQSGIPGQVCFRSGLCRDICRDARGRFTGKHLCGL